MNNTIDPDYGFYDTKYLIPDNDEEGTRIWEGLNTEFNEIFGSMNTDGEAYELPDWHLGTMRLWVYLYTEKFYNPTFIPAIVRIIKSANRPAFAEFECYSDEQNLSGCFQVFEDVAHFDHVSETSGLYQKLIPAPAEHP